MMGRVKILRLIGMLVVMAVMSSPPERTALSGAGTQYSEHKLGWAAGFKGLVGKVAVVKSGNCEHSHQEEGGREPNGEGTNPSIEGQQAGHVKRYERYNTQGAE